jgi:hypothetical protein
MGLQCLVIPRAGLVPADCRRLGEALHRWRSADPAARSLDPHALDDLRDGELPPPRYVRFLRAAQERAKQALSCQEREDIRSGLGDGADTRDLERHIGGEADEGAASRHSASSGPCPVTSWTTSSSAAGAGRGSGGAG